MDKIEKIRQKIERLYNDKSYSEDRWDMGYDCACEDMISFLDTLSEEPDKSLEEAAEKFARFYDNGTCDGIAQDCFIAGAEWQADHAPLPEDTVIFQKGIEEGKRLEMEDIMKDAVEKTVGQLERQWGGNIHFMHGFEVDEMDFPFLNSQECGYGDKVRIIIVKEDKK